MSNAVMLKSFPNGISVKLDPDVDFEVLYRELIEKFNASAKFFGKARLVISFEGRSLTDEEEEFLVKCIDENTDITIACILGRDETKEAGYLKALQSFSENGTKHGGQFYKGSIKAGENVETDSSLIILGDVHPGANVSASGNIVILGTLFGHAHAGCFGDDRSFIATLDLKPTRVRIADCSEMIEEKSNIFMRNKAVPKILYVENGRIKADAITADNLSRLPF